MKRTEQDVSVTGDGCGDGGAVGYNGDSFANVRSMGYEGVRFEYKIGPQSDYEDAVE